MTETTEPTVKDVVDSFGAMLGAAFTAIKKTAIEELGDLKNEFTDDAPPPVNLGGAGLYVSARKICPQASIKTNATAGTIEIRIGCSHSKRTARIACPESQLDQAVLAGLLETFASFPHSG